MNVNRPLVNFHSFLFTLTIPSTRSTCPNIIWLMFILLYRPIHNLNHSLLCSSSTQPKPKTRQLASLVPRLASHSNMLQKNSTSTPNWFRFIKRGAAVLFVLEAASFGVSYGVWHRMNTNRGECFFSLNSSGPGKTGPRPHKAIWNASRIYTA